MGQNRDDLSKVLEKIVKEIYDVKESINELKKEPVESEENSEGSDKIYKDIINSLIKSNLELHAKISELIVVINGLSKDLKELLNIFKEAALFYIEGKPSLKSGNIEKKVEEMENLNKRILEALDNLRSEIEKLKEEKEKKEERTIRRPIPPPPIQGIKRIQ
ncbi:MAG: hypothetical protein BXU00_01735 [Candidatus Nanoclepta minutus]|uniref:Uncharacterized protein n=1 Tax=Candidatus Nanoclepta minutus TaxID=1940235 RepID=A0A397WS35_9ARCH|nr:MAG: hypothetical protein BXU00_01735 [Candidatus Nanoclepta minutus]